MKRPKPPSPGAEEHGHLFRKTAVNRRRRLILLKYLQDEAAKPINQGPAVEAAHQIFLRWANLESTGKAHFWGQP